MFLVLKVYLPASKEKMKSFLTKHNLTIFESNQFESFIPKQENQHYGIL